MQSSHTSIYIQWVKKIFHLCQVIIMSLHPAVATKLKDSDWSARYRDSRAPTAKCKNQRGDGAVLEVRTEPLHMCRIIRWGTEVWLKCWCRDDTSGTTLICWMNEQRAEHTPFCVCVCVCKGKRTSALMLLILYLYADTNLQQVWVRACI